VFNDVTTMKRFGMEREEFIINFLKVTNKKLTIQEHIMHGRLKILVAGPSNRGPERWWAMVRVVMAMAALVAFVHEDYGCNEIVYISIYGRRIKCSKQKKEKKGSTKRGRWGNTLDCSNGLTVPHKVFLEKVV
jgi:hypothetical protein